MMMKKIDDWDGIDGRPITYSLAHIFEAQMWNDIAKFRKENPDLFRVSIKGNNIVGKVMITSTVDEIGNDFQNIWNTSNHALKTDDVDSSKEENGLYRIFISVFYNKEK